jgi:2-polyprenyl-6-methoxyphenol hydroxylase-like FAD-dependent oxidoreductase
MHEPDTDSEALPEYADRRRPDIEQAVHFNRRDTDTKLAA